MLLTPETTDKVSHSLSAAGAFHYLGKLDDSKALYAACKGRSLMEEFLLKEEQRELPISQFAHLLL